MSMIALQVNPSMCSTTCPQVIVITDGEPAGEPPNTISNVIKGAKNLCANSQYGPGAIAFQFAQVLHLPCSQHSSDSARLLSLGSSGRHFADGSSP